MCKQARLFTGLRVLIIYSQIYSFGSSQVPVGITQDPSYPSGPRWCIDGRSAVVVAPEFVAGDVVPGQKGNQK